MTPGAGKAADRLRTSSHMSSFKLNTGHFIFAWQLMPNAPCGSPVPFRKEHLHNWIRACPATRAEPGSDDVDFLADPVKLPPLHDADVWPDTRKQHCIIQ